MRTPQTYATKESAQAAASSADLCTSVGVHSDTRSHHTAQRQRQSRADSSTQHLSLVQRAAHMHAPVQRTIFNMGDDEGLAAKDGASIANHLGQEHIGIPIPKMRAQDAVLAHASNPFVVMFHGHTLKNMGVEAFQHLLISQGYPRSKGLELVLITCSAHAILGDEAAQNLSNLLQSKVRAARGKVVVAPDGVPRVHTKNPERIHSEDIFGLMGTDFEDFTEGWRLFTPQAEESLQFITRDARMNLYHADQHTSRVERLQQYQALAPQADQIDGLAMRLSMLKERLQIGIERGAALQGRASNPDMLVYRGETDTNAERVRQFDNSVTEIESAWEAKNGKSIARHHLDQLFSGDLDDAAKSGDEEVNGWGDDGDLDALLAELDPEAPSGSSGDAASHAASHAAPSDAQQEQKVSSLKSKSTSTTPVIQRAIIADEQAFPDGRTLLNLTSTLADIALVTGAALNLHLHFGDIGDDQYAITRLLMEGAPVVAFDGLIEENRDKNFSIEIILSQTLLNQDASQYPQLIATLIHEWELHGRQFALNVFKLKTDQVPDEHMGHGQFFAPGPQALDHAMSQGIHAARAEEKAGVLAAYMEDTEAHQGFVRAGWVEGNNSKAQQLHHALCQLKASWNIVHKIAPGEGQHAYEALVQAFMIRLNDPYFDEDDPAATVEGLLYLFEEPRTAYQQLIAIYAKTIPEGNEIYSTARNMLRSNLRSILLDWTGFMDAALLHEHGADQPRKQAMTHLGHPTA